MTNKKVNIIGAGLAGSEAALYLAPLGYDINLFEMRPCVDTQVHKTDNFGELVCSNSLGSLDKESASGLLKHEALILGSNLFQIALNNKVPSGNSLSVAREDFAQEITQKIKFYKNINIIREEITEIDLDTPTIVATGPLTSDKLSNYIVNLFGEENHNFYDAVAPIVRKDSIDFNSAFWASRWDKGDKDFINCPLNEDEYNKFHDFLINAERITDVNLKSSSFFESCLPIEVLASRGKDTLRFGPMKPVGLFDRRLDGEYKKYQFHAVIQLRQDDKIADLYNLVGFQTNLKWSEQKKLLQIVPALKNVEIVRYGVMHKNSFINSPKILNPTLQTRKYKNLFFAGQVTGTEGYSESIVGGLFAAINMHRYLTNKKLLTLKDTSILGALMNYISYPEHTNFQPINSNWGIINKDNLDRKLLKNKKEKNKVLSGRALAYINEIKEELNEN